MMMRDEHEEEVDLEDGKIPEDAWMRTDEPFCQ